MLTSPAKGSMMAAESPSNETWFDWVTDHESRVRLGLRLISASCIGMVGLSIAWALWPLPTSDFSSTTRPRTRVTDRSSLDTESDSTVYLARSWQGGFRKPTVVVAPQPMQAAKPIATRAPTPMERLGWRLVGTVIEPGQSMAIATDPSGSLTFHYEGEIVNRAGVQVHVEQIRSDRVDFRFDGQPVTLRVGQNQTLTRAIDASTDDEIELVDDNAIKTPSRTSATERGDFGFETESDLSIEDELEMLNGF
ncbi:MAG: hypothetical protein AAF539_08115 [Planctomycetota bacterium]